jgi:hypothetical protein
MSIKDFIPNDGSLWSIRAVDISGNYNQKLSLDSSGSAVIRTGNTDRLTINSSGAWTCQGGMTYNNATNTLTASNFSGTATNATNVNITASSTNTSFYPTFVSSTSGNLPPLVDTELTYNPSSNTLSVPNINVSSNIQYGGANLVRIVSGSISYPFTPVQTTHIITMPTGCTCFNLVSFQPVAAINNILYIYNWAVGNWSGVQNTNQIRITAQLGNSIHLENFTLQFYWTV